MSTPAPGPSQVHDAWWWQQASEHPGESRFAVVRGARLHYRRWARGRGPLLVLVHGFRGHTHWWDWIAPSLAHDFDVVALDLSGMGDSAHRERYDRAVFANDILGLIGHLDGPATVVGHSFGGTSLLLACALDGESGQAPLIDHAVVIDSWIRFPVDPPYQPGQLGRGQVYTDFEAARTRFRLVPSQPVADAAMMDHLARHSVRQDDQGWRWKFDPDMPEIPPLADGRELLRRVRTPTDIVFGEGSAIVNRERARRCVDALPRGRGPFGIPLAHHHMMFDQPVALVATLRALLGTRQPVTKGRAPPAPSSPPRGPRPRRRSSG